MFFLLSSCMFLVIAGVAHLILFNFCLAGVLEANFVEPAHDKQGFERTTVLAKLESRLIQMQKTYWFEYLAPYSQVAASALLLVVSLFWSY